MTLIVETFILGLQNQMDIFVLKQKITKLLNCMVKDNHFTYISFI